MPQTCFDVRTVNKANKIKRTLKLYLNAITANVISFGENLFCTV